MVPVSAVLNDGAEKAQLWHMSFYFSYTPATLSHALRTVSVKQGDSETACGFVLCVTNQVSELTLHRLKVLTGFFGV